MWNIKIAFFRKQIINLSLAAMKISRKLISHIPALVMSVSSQQSPYFLVALKTHELILTTNILHILCTTDQQFDKF